MASPTVQKEEKQVTGWVGWVYFAAFLLLLGGFFQTIMGLTALLNDKFYAVASESLLVFDFTTWGWFHLLFGIVMLCVGTALFSGHMWARIVATVLAAVYVLEQFAFVSAYPIWSITAIVIGVFIIFALTVHGSEAKE